MKNVEQILIKFACIGAFLFSALLTTLKLTNVIDVMWEIVIAPVWIFLGISIFIIIGFFIACLFFLLQIACDAIVDSFHRLVRKVFLRKGLNNDL